VQKVVELLEECKGKVESDLAAEGKAMEEYTQFCDDELKDKGYAIETAGRAIEDLSATVESTDAQILELEDEIATLGTLISTKSGELMEASKERASERKDFSAAEKELVQSVDELTRAGQILKKGLSFSQIRGGKKFKKHLVEVVNALNTIVESQWLDISSKRRLQSFIQAHSGEDDDDSFGGRFENKHRQPQAKMVAYESSSGGILKTIQEMQGKAEDTLSELRKKEMSDEHAYENIDNTLSNEVSHAQEKLSTAKSSKAANEEAQAAAEGELVETKKSKAADEEYASTLKGECEAKASEWAARLKSAAEEMAAIDKAKEILVSGVKAFVQVSARTHRKSDEDEEDAEEAKEDAVRNRVVKVLKKVATKAHSFKLVQIASMAASDPFVKIRGLIEDMIAKLVKEAEEEATHEAFCQKEMGSSKAAQDDKQMKVDKYKVRIDKAATDIAKLTEEVKTLESEVAEIDKAQAEATEIRETEHAEYVKASTDFKESAEAVAKAIEVLKNFYEGSFIQLSATTHLKSKQPELGGAKSDTAHTIISVLEMSEEDFTTLLAETEETENEAAKKYKALSDENKIAKSTKEADAKGKESNIKSLKVSLEHHREDHASVSKELDAVNAYIDKLKPECESKAMSYEERKAAREAEIEGLKEALTILDGSGI
jgi:chromosome segregation ATPase